MLIHLNRPGFIWSHENITVLIFSHQCVLTGRVLARGLFYLVLSEYTNRSHNFKNLNFCDVTLLFSMTILKKIVQNKKSKSAEPGYIYLPFCKVCTKMTFPGGP